MVSSGWSHIVQCWRALELLNPQPLPRIQKASRQSPFDEQVVRLRPGGRLPWEYLQPPKAQKGKKRVWRHVIFAGIYPLQSTHNYLRTLFRLREGGYEEKVAGNSACAALMLNECGEIIKGTAELSSALWAVGSLRTVGFGNSDWVEGFSEAKHRFSMKVDDFAEQGLQAEVTCDEGSKTLRWDDLTTLLDIAQSISGVRDLAEIFSDYFIIKSYLVNPHTEEANLQRDFLNSFFLDDLARVSRQNIDSQSACGIYLSEQDTAQTGNRIDLRKDRNVVLSSVTPSHIPLGRWPARPEHSLALSQQFAVNKILDPAEAAQKFVGVNGPPGTGKTTMLRDIIAANVVQRAQQLAALRRPGDGFVPDKLTWSTEQGYKRSVFALKPEITGYEMVVASANNAAVLGNRAKRKKFIDLFWSTPKQVKSGPKIPDMKGRLEAWYQGKEPIPNWDESRRNFRRAQRRVEKLKAECESANQRRIQLVAIQEKLLQASQLLTSTQLQLEEIRQKLHEIAVVRKQSEEHYALTKAQYERQLNLKPGLLETWLDLGGQRKTWRAALAEISAALTQAEETLRQYQDEESQLRATENKCEEQRLAAQDAFNQSLQEHDELANECSNDKARFLQNYPDEQWQGDQQELYAPWLNKELEIARSELFLAALQLHHDFIANNAGRMLTNLRAVCDIVKGSAPADLSPQKTLAAWQVLFLVVPVISTTFASCGSMFQCLTEESIGWLFIDEAGQAAPQHALGAIWRSKRVVAVGDPLQLQPVVTLPAAMQRGIIDACKVPSLWIPPNASVQTLADRVSRYGTTLNEDSDPIWVSMPLRVHRRCSNPMFQFCNEVAYDGIMVHGVHEASENKQLPKSFWCDEPATNPGTHIQQRQLERFQNGLQLLLDQGIPTTDIIAITPFRELAKWLEKFSRKYPGLRAGTIHTAQGREANIVFFVLGGDPARNGAKKWAASSVNLINVAVSRAKRRLYVVGDREAWKQYQYFAQLAELLP